MPAKAVGGGCEKYHRNYGARAGVRYTDRGAWAKAGIRYGVCCCSAMAGTRIGMSGALAGRMGGKEAEAKGGQRQ